MVRRGRASTQNRILLVDNEQDILDIMARVLQSAGYTIDMANDGRAALERVLRQDYALIISNIRMPVMGGEAFYHQLCSSHADMSERIIFCTGDTANAGTRRFLSATGAPVIYKPFHLDTVLDVVSSKLEVLHSPAGCPSLPLAPSGPVTAPAY